MSTNESASLANDIISVARRLQELSGDGISEVNALLARRTPENHHPIQLHFDTLYIRVIATRVSKKAGL